MTGKSSKWYESISHTVSPEQNFKNLRAALKSTSGGCVPYLGIYLADMTFIEDGNPDKLAEDDNMVNFMKYRLLSSVIREVIQFQQLPHNLEELPLIQDFVVKTEPLANEEAWQLSLQREPRGPKKDGSKKDASLKKDKKDKEKKKYVVKTSSSVAEGCALFDSGAASKAFSAFQSVAECDQPLAHLMLADMYELGIGCSQQDFTLSIQHLNKALSSANPEDKLLAFFRIKLLSQAVINKLKLALLENDTELFRILILDNGALFSDQISQEVLEFAVMHNMREAAQFLVFDCNIAPNEQLIETVKATEDLQLFLEVLQRAELS